MLLSSCGGLSVRGDVASETESYEGFDIEYSPRGFRIHGEDSHDHDVFYSWWSQDGSGHLELRRSDSISFIDDENGDGVVDYYSGPDVLFHMDYQCVDSNLQGQVQDVFEEHLQNELPVQHAQERWEQRWRNP